MVGRFINADGVLGANDDMATYNLFVYCGNNPINRFEICGCSWDEFWSDLHKFFFTEEQWRIDENIRYGTPIYGDPNSWLHIPGANGNDIDRYFGPDGRASYDVHWGHSHHHSCGSPHTEEWKWDGDKPMGLDAGSARPYDPSIVGVPDRLKDAEPPSPAVPNINDNDAINAIIAGLMLALGLITFLATGNPSGLSPAFA